MDAFKRLLKISAITHSAIAIGSQMIFQIEIGIEIEIAISISSRDRDRDLNFCDRGHALDKGQCSDRIECGVNCKSDFRVWRFFK